VGLVLAGGQRRVAHDGQLVAVRADAVDDGAQVGAGALGRVEQRGVG
jgi:hypothetical protein